VPELAEELEPEDEPELAVELEPLEELGLEPVEEPELAVELEPLEELGLEPVEEPELAVELEPLEELELEPVEEPELAVELEPLESPVELDAVLVVKFVEAIAGLGLETPSTLTVVILVLNSLIALSYVAAPASFLLDVSATDWAKFLTTHATSLAAHFKLSEPLLAIAAIAASRAALSLFAVEPSAAKVGTSVRSTLKALPTNAFDSKSVLGLMGCLLSTKFSTTMLEKTSIVAVVLAPALEATWTALLRDKSEGAGTTKPVASSTILVELSAESSNKTVELAGKPGMLYSPLSLVV